MGLVYVDDGQVTDVSAAKRDLNANYRVRGLPLALAEGFASSSEFVHICIEEAPDPRIDYDERCMPEP